ncbi:DNA repair protein RadC [Proteiniborus ethanoligenes]|uniref:DNA repair protein RadC n=1 Tax=Proteiniborus ethanoligenes TaxID=415015 RepID=A0A1H3RNI4_9FIRM|nr:DNA repair protein RadC [Proteiniborus ethanoligenes]SDZ27190.1 DNA repair protein RadC [Proteiniborus ethanoligenes]
MKELLRSILKEESVQYIENNYPNLKTLANSTKKELLQIPGVGEKSAKQLKAIFEISKQLLLPKDSSCYIKSPKDIYDYVKSVSLFEEERVIAILLNTKNKVISHTTISVGSLNSSIIHPREFFAPAVRLRAHSIIAAHNHPSGDLTPSKEDIEITKRLKDSGNVLGIKLLDHIIVGDNKYVSLKEYDII